MDYYSTVNLLVDVLAPQPVIEVADGVRLQTMPGSVVQPVADAEPEGIETAC
jgi:hypothetical protein